MDEKEKKWYWKGFRDGAIGMVFFLLGVLYISRIVNWILNAWLN